MPIRRGEKMQTHSTKSIVFHRPPEVYTIYETPPTLATSQQGTPDFSYTVNSADFVTLTGNVLSYTQLCMLLCVARFPTAGTINYEVKKNSVSIFTGNIAVATGAYITLQMRDADLRGIQNGDVLDVYLWSNQSDSQLIFKSITYNVTRIKILTDQSDVSQKIFDVEIEYDSNKRKPDYSEIGTSYIVATSSGYLFSANSNNVYSTSALSQTSYSGIYKTGDLYGYSANTFEFYRAYNGDNSAATGSSQSTTTYPRYWVDATPTVIYFKTGIVGNM